MDSAPAISVVIPARDAAETLPRALEAVARQEGAPAYEVIVVDDGSRDETAAIAHDLGARVISADGGGPASARNAGVAEARGGLLAFTDADCVPTPGWLAAGAEALALGAELVQGRVWPSQDVVGGPFDRTLWVGAETGLYETANLFVTRGLFERIGGFESWLRPRRGVELGEDVWLGWRARRAGAQTTFAPEALVHHAVLRRSAAAFIAERARLRYFPALAGRVPELRSELFFAHLFLNERTAAFDVALVVGGALAWRRRTCIATLASLPYLAIVAREARGWGWRLAPRVALAGIAADAVGAAALLCGSLARRSPLL